MEVNNYSFGMVNTELRDTGKNIGSVFDKEKTAYSLGRICAVAAARVNLKNIEAAFDAFLFKNIAHLLEDSLGDELDDDKMKEEIDCFADKARRQLVSLPLNQAQLYRLVVQKIVDGKLDYLGEKLIVAAKALKKRIPQEKPEYASKRGAEILLKYFRP